MKPMGTINPLFRQIVALAVLSDAIIRRKSFSMSFPRAAESPLRAAFARHFLRKTTTCCIGKSRMVFSHSRG